MLAIKYVDLLGHCSGGLKEKIAKCLFQIKFRQRGAYFMLETIKKNTLKTSILS